MLRMLTHMRSCICALIQCWVDCSIRSPATCLNFCNQSYTSALASSHCFFVALDVNLHQLSQYHPTLNDPSRTCLQVRELTGKVTNGSYDRLQLQAIEVRFSNTALQLTYGMQHCILRLRSCMPLASAISCAPACMYI